MTHIPKVMGYWTDYCPVPTFLHVFSEKHCTLDTAWLAKMRLKTFLLGQCPVMRKL